MRTAPVLSAMLPLLCPRKEILKDTLTRHAKYNDDYFLESEARKMQIKDLKSSLFGQQRSLKKFCTSSRATTIGIASFKTSCFLAKKGKAFSVRELLKGCFLEITDIAFFRISVVKVKLKSAIKDLQLSRNTVMRRQEKMSEDVTHQLYSDFNNCVFFTST